MLTDRIYGTYFFAALGKARNVQQGELLPGRERHVALLHEALIKTLEDEKLRKTWEREITIVDGYCVELEDMLEDATDTIVYDKRNAYK